MMDAQSKAKFIDGLKRAQEMEESMADILIGLFRPALADLDLPKTDLEEIQQILLEIQSDTDRHARAVKALLRANGENIDG